MEIETQVTRGVYRKDIAASLGVHPRTVRRALERGNAPSGKRPQARKSKLDPFKPFIDEQLGNDIWNCRVLLKKIKAKGYKGKGSILRDYVAPKRPMRKSRQTVRFETDPGHQLQHDWGTIWTMIGGTRTKVHFSVNTLGYSRRFHFWCTDSEDASHTYEGIVRAFEYFGGVTGEVLVDNQKSCVIRNRIGEEVQYHIAFVDLAGHYGFRPRACKPYRARTKGKDERNVRYIKENFFQLYDAFESFAHMNQLAELWLSEEADPRVHGTVKEVVADRFEREKPHLQSLPRTRFDTSRRESRWGSWDGYVDVDGNRYSIPDEYRGSQLAVRIHLDDTFRVYAGETMVAHHRKRPASEGWVTVPGHHEKLWRETLRVEQRDLRIYEEVAGCSS